jgi:PatG Domain
MNEQIEVQEMPLEKASMANDKLFATHAPESPMRTAIIPQADNASCGCNSGAANGVAPSYVYAIGRIEVRFPSVAVEKECAQATARTETTGKTDQQSFHAVLSKRENRYLVRQLCWVFTVQGFETYLLKPRDLADIDLLVEAIRPVPTRNDIDVVIGLRGSIAPPEMCNGLMVPIVVFDHVYSFEREALIKAIPNPGKIPPKEFEPSAHELFDRIMQLTDNAGATDEHRALNYLSMRYPAVYATVAECHGRDCSLSWVDVRHSHLSGTRKIMEVIFSFTNRKTDFTEKFCTRVDVTEEFPFLVTKLFPYYDH